MPIRHHCIFYMLEHVCKYIALYYNTSCCNAVFIGWNNISQHDEQQDDEDAPDDA